MSSRKVFIITGLVIFSVVGALNAAANTQPATARKNICNNPFVKEVKQRISRARQSVCAHIETSINIDNSPFVYINADASCDLGFSMPGLPNFKGGIKGVDACQVLRAVTGDLVRDVNRGMQEAVDGALNDVTDGRTNFDIDLTDIAVDQLDD